MTLISLNKFCWVISLLSLIHCQSASFFNSSIGPVAICGKNSLNIESTLSECYERCRRHPQPKSTAQLILHQVTAKGRGPRVVECTKVRVTQTFTMTWTFSTVKTVPSFNYSLPSDDECRSEIDKKCGSYECNERAPVDLKDDYSYASSNEKVVDFITLLTVPSSYFASGDKLMVMPLSSESHFSSDREEGSSLTARYYWKKMNPLEECPFEPAGGKYGCDYYNENQGDEHWLCNRGGFSLTPKANITEAIPVCKNLLQSKEGLIYSVGDSSDKLNIWSQRIGLVGTTYTNADVNYLRDKVNHVMSNMDSDMCLLKCETLSLEARIPRRVPRVLKISANVILLMPDGTGEKCEMAHGCKLSTPHLMCGNPPRVALSCTGTDAYWDPREPYASMHGFCSHPSKYEKLTFTAGHHTYVIDDNLTSQLPSGFMHGKTHDLFSIDHLKGLQFEKEDIDLIRASWNDHKTKSARPAEAVKESVVKDHSGILTDAMSVAQSAFSRLVDMFAYLKYLIILAFIFVMLVMSVKMLIGLLSKNDQETRSVVYTPARGGGRVPTISWN